MRISMSKATQKAIARNIHRSEQEWKKRAAKYPWRSFLTADEKAILERADHAKQAWLELNRERAGITNRAIQRAKYAARVNEEQER